MILLPRNHIHREFTNRKYRVEGGDIHSWMDAPWVYLRVKHRIERHDYDDWIPQRFVERYGLSLAKDIMRSHIWLDENWHWYKRYF